VCGGRLLDDAWVTATEASIADLTSQARAAEAAYDEEASAVRVLGELVPPKPMVLRADFGGEIDASAAATAWDRWAPPNVSAETFAALSTAVAELRSQAAAVLRRRAEAWQPVAFDLVAWVRQARKSRDAAVRLADLRKAIEWLRKIGSQVRNARLAPFAKASAQVWETLRQESNVELGPITLAGAGPQRRVALDVTVDGAPGAALSVMSQGELHALGLALFLPRATSAESPFGFVVIDDPVQSMDPATVDGLARVLSSAAASRQVVVFTHDDRLPAALRQLQLPAAVWAVTRRERSWSRSRRSTTRSRSIWTTPRPSRHHRRPGRTDQVMRAPKHEPPLLRVNQQPLMNPQAVLAAGVGGGRSSRLAGSWWRRLDQNGQDRPGLPSPAWTHRCVTVRLAVRSLLW
jgi:hypothetical protein